MQRCSQPAHWRSASWGHLVYLHGGPVLLIRAEMTRVLFGVWRGARLRELEPRLEAGGKYEMATMTLTADTRLAPATQCGLPPRRLR